MFKTMHISNPYCTSFVILVYFSEVQFEEAFRGQGRKLLNCI